MTLAPDASAPRRDPVAARVIFWIIAAFYAYGAVIHILNMASLTGFPWSDAPLKWRVLDIVYLALDVTVVIGLIRGSVLGVASFFCAAVSQIFLYTLFRTWVLDVPDAYRRSVEDIAYLDGLVIFHIVTCLAMGAALYLRARVRAAAAGRRL